MSAPLISVIIPTYNRSKLIHKSIASIERQSYRNYEIIVIDDGSSDDTRQVVTELKIPNLSYIRHPVNLGANAARNTGIEAATGDFIAFQDSDDAWHPDKLEIQTRAITEHGADICFCAFTRHNRGRVSMVPKPGYQIESGYRNIYSALLRGNFIGVPTLLVRRELLLRVGLFDENLPRLQDWELCLRLARDNPIAYVDQSLVDVEVGDDSLSRRNDNYARAAQLILAKHAPDFVDDPVAAAMLCANVALDALHHRQPLTFLRFLGDSIRRGGRMFLPAMAGLYRRR